MVIGSETANIYRKRRLPAAGCVAFGHKSYHLRGSHWLWKECISHCEINVTFDEEKRVFGRKVLQKLSISWIRLVAILLNRKQMLYLPYEMFHLVKIFSRFEFWVFLSLFGGIFHASQMENRNRNKINIKRIHRNIVPVKGSIWIFEWR